MSNIVYSYVGFTELLQCLSKWRKNCKSTQSCWTNQEASVSEVYNLNNIYIYKCLFTFCLCQYYYEHICKEISWTTLEVSGKQVLCTHWKMSSLLVCVCVCVCVCVRAHACACTFMPIYLFAYSHLSISLFDVMFEYVYSLPLVMPPFT